MQTCPRIISINPPFAHPNLHWFIFPPAFLIGGVKYHMLLDELTGDFYESITIAQEEINKVRYTYEELCCLISTL